MEEFQFIFASVLTYESVPQLRLSWSNTTFKTVVATPTSIGTLQARCPLWG